MNGYLRLVGYDKDHVIHVKQKISTDSTQDKSSQRPSNVRNLYLAICGIVTLILVALTIIVVTNQPQKETTVIKEPIENDQIT